MIRSPIFSLVFATIMKRLILGSMTSAALLGSEGLAEANLILNGGFETGDFTDWAVFANATGVGPGSFDGFFPHSGTNFASLGNRAIIGPNLGTLSQTVSDTAGQSYVLSMFLGSDGRGANEFRVDWNGTPLYDQTGLPDTRGNTPQYNLLSFTVVGTGSDTLTLYEASDSGFLALDDVSLAPPSSVPEPSTLVMSSILFGVGGVGLVYRRFKKTATAV
jgi:hypothetical protein